jgi:hypothetical protein
VSERVKCGDINVEERRIIKSQAIDAPGEQVCSRSITIDLGCDTKPRRTKEYGISCHRGIDRLGDRIIYCTIDEQIQRSNVPPKAERVPRAVKASLAADVKFSIIDPIIRENDE